MKKNDLLRLLIMTGKYLCYGFMIQLFTFTVLFATDGVAQYKSVKDVHITLNITNATLVEAIQAIESKTSFKFTYEEKDLVGRHGITVQADNQTVEQVLMDIGRTARVEFKQVNDNIHVKPVTERKKQEIIEISQVIQVTGTVTSSSDGLGIPGANIVAKGTATGTVTDVEGNYSFNVPNEDDILVFSSIGYATQEVAVNGRAVIDVILEEDMQGLDEVVVVGYGTQKKTSLTSAVSTVDGKDMQSVPVANPNNALGGRVTGAIVRQNSGEPGNDAATINIRGIGTLGNSDPLVVVDGVYRDLASLNPYEIESITVLKDAASVAPYGVRGANGVILVTTKRGAAGKLTFSYNGNVGLQTPTAMPNVLSSYEYAKLKNVANQNVGQNPSYNEEDLQKFRDGSSPDRYPNTNLFDMLLEPSLMTQHNLSLSGGTDKVKAFFLLGYLDQKSNWGNATRFKKYNLRTNVDFNISENTNVSFDFSSRVRDATFPGIGADNVMIGFYRINPT
ncbi:MAG: SusC/RagA family TonB-linked outer membrane protein, partial [Anditalea sp.]